MKQIEYDKLNMVFALHINLLIEIMHNYLSAIGSIFKHGNSKRLQLPANIQVCIEENDVIDKDKSSRQYKNTAYDKMASVSRLRYKEISIFIAKHQQKHNYFIFNINKPMSVSRTYYFWILAHFYFTIIIQISSPIYFCSLPYLFIRLNPRTKSRFHSFSHQNQNNSFQT